MSPFRYQLNKSEFKAEWRDSTGRPMSESTYQRRRKQAEDYPDGWRVFLPDGRVDIQEYQRFITWLGKQKHKRKQDPRLAVYQEY
ncbi:hypothetical protein HCY48_05175 [Limosilactobacillus fermentum]